MKATVRRTDGTVIELDGAPEEVERVLRAEQPRPWPSYMPVPFFEPWPQPIWRIETPPKITYTTTSDSVVMPGANS